MQVICESISGAVLGTLQSKRLIEDCSANITSYADAFAIQDSVTTKIAAQSGGFAG